MDTRFFEATDGHYWGKFAVCRFVLNELHAPSLVGGHPLLLGVWHEKNAYVLDLETGEGARFRLGGCAPADLRKHPIRVGPLFEPFLEWLYAQTNAGKDVADLPSLVRFEPGAMATALATFREARAEVHAIAAQIRDNAHSAEVDACRPPPDTPPEHRTDQFVRSNPK